MAICFFLNHKKFSQPQVFNTPAKKVPLEFCNNVGAIENQDDDPSRFNGVHSLDNATMQQIWHLLSALCSVMWKIFYIGAHLHSLL